MLMKRSFFVDRVKKDEGFYFNNKSIRDVLDLYRRDEETCIELYGPIEEWDVSQVTDMSRLFFCDYPNYISFNKDLSKWNMENVHSTACMFYGCWDFNQDLSMWNVENVSNMACMFYGCKSFNQDLSMWNVKNVKRMDKMFKGCENFNQDLTRWNTINVESMEDMFFNCKKFNQNISLWNIKSLRYGMFMLYNCSEFNQDLSAWIITRANITGAFKGTKIKKYPRVKWFGEQRTEPQNIICVNA